jgi:hypothetical protein
MNTIVDKQICGFCNTAWDLVYKRCRSVTSVGQWVGYCREGGCDPDIWDYIDDNGGLAEDEVPEFMPHLFHRRDHNNPYGWKFGKRARAESEGRVSYTPQQLYEKQLAERQAQKAAADEIEWDSDDEEDIEWE